MIKLSAIALISSGLIALSIPVARTQPTEGQKSESLEKSIQRQVALRRILMKKYAFKILELQKLIYKYSSLFSGTSRLRRDAGPFLNPRVEWQDVINDASAKAAYNSFKATLGEASVIELTLPAAPAEKLRSLGANYYKKADEIDLKNIDFGWFKILKNYDFWNVEINSPLEHLDRFDFTQSPVVNMAALVGWAKLRLVMGVQEKNVKSAIDEVLHLGQLLHSTETLIGAVSSLVVLKAVFEFAKDQGEPLKVDPAVFEKAKLYFMTLSQALSHPLIDVRDFSSLISAGIGPGYCAVLNEAGSGLLMFKPLLENDLKDFYAKYAETLNSKKTCRWVHMRRAWAGDLKYVLHFKSMPTSSIEARKQASNLIKQILSEKDYKNLAEETANPRWPQYFGYLQALPTISETMFSQLNQK